MEVIHTIHSVLKASVKDSGSAHYCLPVKTSFKLCYVNYVMLG